MKTIGDTNYYSKAEIAEQFGCAVNTISTRISNAKIRGYYFGHTKYFTMEQIQQILEHSRGKDAEK